MSKLKIMAIIFVSLLAQTLAASAAQAAKIPDLTIWDGNLATHKEVFLSRGDPDKALIFTKEVGEIAKVRIGSKSGEPLNAFVCARIVEVDSAGAAARALTDWQGRVINADERRFVTNGKKPIGNNFAEFAFKPDRAARRAKVEARYVAIAKAEDAENYECYGARQPKKWQSSILSEATFAVRPGAYILNADLEAKPLVAEKFYNYAQIIAGEKGAAGYDQKSTALRYKIVWNEDRGQPSGEDIWSGFELNFKDGVGALGFSFNDVGEFRLRIEDAEFAANDIESGACVSSGDAKYRAANQLSAAARNGISVNAEDYKLGCVIAGGYTHRDPKSGKVSAGLLGALVKVVPAGYKISQLSFSSDRAIGDNKWTYYANEGEGAAIEVSFTAQAVGFLGKIMQNYTDGNYSRPSKPAIFTQKNSPLKSWFDKDRISAADWGAAGLFGEARIKSRWNFERDLAKPAAPIVLRRASQDFNITIVEDNGGAYEPISGAAIWGAGCVSGEEFMCGKARETTFVYGRANIHDAFTHGENVGVAYSIDYFYPKEIAHSEGFGKGAKPLESLIQNVASKEWARIMGSADAGAAGYAFDDKTEANISADLRGEIFAPKAYSPRGKGVYNIKLADQSGAKVFTLAYPIDAPRPSKFVTHLSIPPFLWHAPQGESYVSIRETFQNVENRRDCFKHPCGSAEFLDRRSARASEIAQAGLEGFEGAELFDPKNKRKSPARIRW
ncbi:MAG: hypothetical protein LBU73_00735 [Helicobacteraceae bacterium]|jgi:hypothetical protein|nr:hypothetical protein [Helicobacteraceae bacterium]